VLKKDVAADSEVRGQTLKAVVLNRFAQSGRQFIGERDIR
jgi:hypothetical protein